MPSAKAEAQPLFAPRAVSRLTGLTAHCLRAWERRYGAVQPLRTAGGARRYSEQDVRRLRVLRRAVEAGHPISQVAQLSEQEITHRLSLVETAPAVTATPAIEDLLAAARDLDVDRMDRLLALRLALLGTSAFACDVAVPLLRRIGEEWERGRLSPAEEHAASATLRSLLGDTLRRDAQHATGPRLVFSTPSGEHHELGALIAASYALGLGARSIFLGANLPAEQLADSAVRLDARAVALGIADLDPERSQEEVARLRSALPDDVLIWLGGIGATSLSDFVGAETISCLEELKEHVLRIH